MNTAGKSRSELEEWLDAFLRDPAFLEAYPYYAAILAKLTPVADPSVKRMAVSLHDGRFYLHVNVDSFMAEPPSPWRRPLPRSAQPQASTASALPR